MSKVIKINHIPDCSIISKGFGKIDYCDAYHIVKKTNEKVDNIITNLFRSPKWVRFLMKSRNLMVSFLKLKTLENIEKNIADYYPTGSKAVYFTVIDRTENEIVMAENDTHLNFRLSVLIQNKNSYTDICLTTLVRFNNNTGRIYFFIIKPFHRIIVKSILKRVLV